MSATESINNEKIPKYVFSPSKYSESKIKYAASEHLRSFEEKSATMKQCQLNNILMVNKLGMVL